MDTKKRKVVVTPNHYRGVKEWCLDVIECPKCNSEIPGDSKFCCMCGIELKLSTTVIFLIENLF